MSAPLYSTVLIIRALSTTISNAPLVIWGFIELLLVCILIHLHKEAAADESKLKYFIVQSVSRAIWLTTTLHPWPLDTLIITRLILKLGLFPLHTWVNQVYSGASLSSILPLSTWTKTPPLLAISLPTQEQWWAGLILVSVIRGTLGGWASVSFKKLIAWRRITHTSWICLLSPRLVELLRYFVLYLAVLNRVLRGLSEAAIDSFNQHLSLPLINRFMSVVGLISIACTPPLTGFWLKILPLGIIIEVGGWLLTPIVAVLAIGVYIYFTFVVGLLTRLCTPNFKVVTLLPLGLVVMNLSGFWVLMRSVCPNSS